MLDKHTTYEAEAIGVLLGIYMLRFEKEIGEVRLVLDNQAVIVALDSSKSGPAQYLTDKILCQTQMI